MTTVRSSQPFPVLGVKLLPTDGLIFSLLLRVVIRQAPMQAPLMHLLLQLQMNQLITQQTRLHLFLPRSLLTRPPLLSRMFRRSSPRNPQQMRLLQWKPPHLPKVHPALRQHPAPALPSRDPKSAETTRGALGPGTTEMQRDGRERR